ncbi:MAG TPA: metallophosphoesterase [Solirubrobacterales bacterium]|nr:metallophosphoesterase [Solirubrobacterales bacterium]
MRTVIVSDLHLAVGASIDLLRSEPIRAVLAPELERADRVVLLGDVVELRDRPQRRAIELARPVIGWIAAATGGGELVVVAGNHDHHLVAPWLERRSLGSLDGIGLEQDVELPDGALRELTADAGSARVKVSYPGIWVRPDVYATHGHYLDRHLTIPTMERLGVAIVERLLGVAPGLDRSAPPASSPEGTASEYEQVQTPVYEFLFALAQASPPDRRAGADPSLRIWQLLSGGESRAAKIRGWLLGSVALPGAVGVANRLGLGPVGSDLSPEAITAAGLEAMGEVVDRLRIDARHVVFGHTHRRGPLADDPEWRAGEMRLWNTGSWVASPTLVGTTGSRSPYWPGTVAIVGDSGPPELRHLLDGWTLAELERATGR